MSDATPVPPSTLAALCQWYLRQCDGEWEHEFGVTIESLDNPGFSVTINLEGTNLEGTPEFKERHRCDVEDDSPPWWYIEVKNRRFSAACDPLSLSIVLEKFLSLT